MIGFFIRPNDFGILDFLPFEIITYRFPCYSYWSLIDQSSSAELRQKSRNPSCIVKILKMMWPTRGQAAKMRGPFANFIKGVEGEINPRFPGDRREVKGCIG